MKKLLFLGVGIILLVVVAAVGMSLVGGGAKEEEVAEVKVEEPVVPAETVVYEMRPLGVPVISNNKVRRYVIMSAKFELLARPDQAAHAEEDRPILRDAIVRSVHDKPLRLKEDGSIDQRDLSARFLQSANQVFHGIAKGVEVGEAKAGRPAPPAAAPPPKKKSSGGGH